MGRNSSIIVGAITAGLSVSAAQAQVVRVIEANFTAAVPAITFSEQATGTANPSYQFTNVQGLGDVSVNFEGHFLGQTTKTVGGVVTLDDVTPTGPLTLDANAPDTAIRTDSAAPTSPVLSGTPNFNGPISILFGVPVAGVGLQGGFFNAVNSTSIEAYDVNGNSLGSVTNNMEGQEFFGLRDPEGDQVIKGISFYVTGNEPFGFAIDNVRFGAGMAVPEPTSMALLAVAGPLVLCRGRRRLA